MSEVAERVERLPVGQSVYSESVAANILADMSDGKTVAEICRQPGMPNARTVRRWVRDDVEGFRDKFNVARELQAHAVAEEVMTVAREATDPHLARVRVDAAKWFAAKLLPQVYSDHVRLDAKFSADDEKSNDDLAASVAARKGRLLLAKSS